MAARVIGGPLSWVTDWDDEGYRTYEVEFRVETDSPYEGPAVVMNAAGLPRVGDPYQIDADLDVWAWCRPRRSSSPEVTGEPCKLHRVRCHFSNKPLDKDRSQGGSGGPSGVEDPLMEHPKLSGGLKVETEEAYYDFAGRPITNSAFEQIKGPQVEFSRGMPTVKIEMNVPTFDRVALAYAMQHHVNNVPLWGLPRRCWLLSNVSFERRYYAGSQKYYSLSLEFDGSYETHDREILDEATKVLKGHWDTNPESATYGDYIPDPTANEHNPSHFIQYQDIKGETGKVILNGHGLPAMDVPPDELRFDDTNNIKPWARVGPTSLPSHPPAKSTAECPAPTVTAVPFPEGKMPFPHTFFYALTSITLLGESLMSAPATLETAFEIPAIRIKWPPVEGVSGYHLYKLNNLGPDPWDVANLKDWYLVKVFRTPHYQMQGAIYIAKYSEADFSLLGIPMIL
jgi:hypothetical protein